MSSLLRAKIFVDGSNFFHYCKGIGVPTFPKFDFERFAAKLAYPYTLVDKTYYIGTVRAQYNDHKALRMMSDQMKFFAYLKKNNWKISKGYLLKSNGKYSEKGVDVKLALDLAIDALKDRYDIALLVSSDTDILPAVEQTQIERKHVKYVGFAHRPSKAMTNVCDSRILLTAAYLQKFLI